MVSRPLVHAADQPFEILLVDSRQLVRAGIQRLLSDSGYLTVSGEAASFDEAIRLARKRQPHVLLVNLPASSVDVLDGARKIRRQFPDTRLLVMGEEADLIIQERLLQSGVSGCISSHCSVDELFRAIDTVLGGERYLSDRLAQKLAQRRLSNGKGSPLDSLTHRELQILLLVSEGRNTGAIARELCLTQKTVNGYRNRLLEKLQAGTEVELMRIAIRHGLLRIPGCT